MVKIPVACFNEVGVELVLVPFDDSFGKRSYAEKRELIKNLQLDVNSSGMKGTVVPIWKSEEHKHFIAPVELHPFIRGFSWDEIVLSVNYELNLRQ
ncbi:MAG TPA: hypothetical protein VK892_19095 [Pyrinomonadaceae bacterium]|nr:hypothetical protein [Pyrinomonadaceae bacterium]